MKHIILGGLFALLSLYGTTASAELSLQHSDTENGVVIVGNIAALDRSVSTQLRSGRDTLKSLTSLVVPSDWDVYMYQSQSELLLTANLEGYWIDVFAELLENNSMGAVIDVNLKRIDLRHK